MSGEFHRLCTADAWCAAWGLGRGGAWVWSCQVCEVDGQRDGYCGCLGGDGSCCCWCWMGGGVALPLPLVLILILILGLGGYLLRAGLGFFPPRLGDAEVL